MLRTTFTLKEAVAMYKAAHLQYLRGRSTMPDIELKGIAKNSPQNFKTTNGITGAIIKYVTYVGGFANRINSTGRKIKTKRDKEIYIPGTTRHGTPDVDIVYNRHAIKVELKNAATKDRVSPEQSKVKAQLEAAGAIYFFAETFEGFMSWWVNEIEIKTPVIRA
jgi:hypothetical protein